MEKNEYRLVISIEDGESVSGAIANKNQGENQGTKKALSILTAYNVAQPFINGTKAIIQNNVDTKLGSQELSARVNLGMEVASFGAKTLIGLASGRSLASMLGLSATFGGAVGVLVTVGSYAMNVAVKQNEINNKIYIENEQLNILRGRAGVQFNRSRSGE